MKALSAVAFLAVAHADGGIIKANKAKGGYQVCATSDGSDAGAAIIGACDKTDSLADFTYGYISVQPIGFGLSKTSKSMEVYSTQDGEGKSVEDFRNPFKHSGLVKTTTDGSEIEYGFANTGAFIGIDGLADVKTQSGGFIGTSLYVMTEGSVKVKEGTYRFGSTNQDGVETIQYGNIGLPNGETTYSAGDVKMNIYGFSTPSNKNNDYDYFGFRFKYKFTKAEKSGELQEPLFFKDKAGAGEELGVGKYMDEVQAIQLPCPKGTTDCLKVDLSALDVIYGDIPKDPRTPTDGDSTFKKSVALKDSDTVTVTPKSCFETNAAVKKLQVNVFRKGTDEFHVDFLAKSDEFGRDGGRYMNFDPGYTLASDEKKAGSDSGGSDSGEVTSSAVQ